MIEVILKSLGAFPISTSLYLKNGWPWSKTEWNLCLGGEYLVYTFCFWQSTCLRWFWGHSVHFLFHNLVSRKRQFLECNLHQNPYVIQYYVIIVWHLVKQSAKTPGLLVFCSALFYCIAELLLSRASRPSSVKPVFPEPVKQINAKFGGKGTFSPYLQALFCFSKFCIFNYSRFAFFVFVYIGSLGDKNFKRHSHWKFTQDSLQKSGILLGIVSIKVVHRFVGLCLFFSFHFRLSELYSKDISSERTDRFAPQHSCVLLCISTKVVIRIEKFEISNFWHFFLCVCLFGLLTW